MNNTSDAVDILIAKIKHNSDRVENVRFGMINAEIAQLVFKIRCEAGWTQTQLAEKAGVTAETVGLLEDAEYPGDSAAIFFKIVDALGVSPDFAHQGFVHLAESAACLAHTI